MKVKSPCYKCEDREVGCHSKCERYIDFSTKHQEENEAIRRAKEEDWRIRDYESRAKRRIAKRRNT